MICGYSSKKYKCNGYVTNMVLQVLSEVSGTCSLPHREIASRTRHLWLPKRHHYQLRQRKASYSMTRVAHYIPEEWVSPIHIGYISTQSLLCANKSLSISIVVIMVWRKISNGSQKTRKKYPSINRVPQFQRLDHCQENGTQENLPSGSTTTSNQVTFICIALFTSNVTEGFKYAHRGEELNRRSWIGVIECGGEPWLCHSHRWGAHLRQCGVEATHPAHLYLQQVWWPDHCEPRIKPLRWVNLQEIDLL